MIPHPGRTCEREEKGYWGYSTKTPAQMKMLSWNPLLLYTNGKPLKMLFIHWGLWIFAGIHEADVITWGTISPVWGCTVVTVKDGCGMFQSWKWTEMHSQEGMENRAECLECCPWWLRPMLAMFCWGSGRRILSSRPAWSTHWLLGQPGLPQKQTKNDT